MPLTTTPRSILYPLSRRGRDRSTTLLNRILKARFADNGAFFERGEADADKNDKGLCALNTEECCTTRNAILEAPEKKLGFLLGVFVKRCRFRRGPDLAAVGAENFN